MVQGNLIFLFKKRNKTFNRIIIGSGIEFIELIAGTNVILSLRNCPLWSVI
jgi:hypothetical protein